MNAIVISGTLKTYRQSISEFVNNLVKNNDADVFMYLKPNSAWKCRESKESHNDIDHERLIRDTFGDSLKCLVWEEDTPGLKDYITAGWSKINHTWVGTYGKEYVDTLEHSNGGFVNSVDQYLRVRESCRLMKNHAEKNNKTYNNVMRIRLDVLPIRPYKWSEHRHSEGEVSLRHDYEYCTRDALWMCDYKTMIKICEEFPDVYLSFARDNPQSIVLSPEVQLYQYINDNVFFNIRFTNLQLTQKTVDGNSIWVIDEHLNNEPEPEPEPEKNEKIVDKPDYTGDLLFVILIISIVLVVVTAFAVSFVIKYPPAMSIRSEVP
jgi:hypothetical protein